jgi:hypothetical protein
MNEGKYLELCNDMKRQYDNIKKEHIKEIAKKNRIIAEKEELITHLKSLLQSQSHKTGQFDSIRPSADIARYTNVMGMMSSFD